MDDGTFPALLKTLSDSSEEVRKSLLTWLSIVWVVIITGDQAWSSTSRTDILEFGRKLLQSFHDKLARAVQYWQTVTGNERKSYYPSTLSELKHWADLSNFRGDPGKGGGGLIPWSRRVEVWPRSLGFGICWCNRSKVEHHLDNISRISRFP